MDITVRRTNLVTTTDHKTMPVAISLISSATHSSIRLTQPRRVPISADSLRQPTQETNPEMSVITSFSTALFTP